MHLNSGKESPCFVNHLPVALFRVAFIFLFILYSSISFGQLPNGFIRERIATGLNPTSIVVGDDGRIFITEKNGVIRIIRDDQLLEDPFLVLEVDDANERGLGHMVLHPDFEQNGFYYVFYSVPGMRHNRVSRFTANGDYTIPGSEVIILDLDLLGGDIHNGGDMVFGFDGNLYISTGDGGQNWRGEDLGSTNGKILRVDDAGNAVPENSWYSLEYLRANLVYAYGFRNPFTITRNPITGEIFANDVGGEKYEEVNNVVAGGFYGWPKVEGKRTTEVVPAEYRDPVFQYAHANNYCAIVGSAFYFPEVQQFPEKYAGKYFYSDYCTGHIRILDPETGIDKGTFITDGDRVIDIDIAAEGSLYYLERKGLGDGSPDDNTGTSDGALWKVSYTGSGAPFISIQPLSVLSAVGENATFTVGASGAIPLVYKWLINGEELKEADAPSLELKDVVIEQDSSTIQVEVSNEFGQQFSDIVLLRVTANHRPEPVITSPVEGTMYKAGTTITFSGFAGDQEDGNLAVSALSWKIDFHHGTHTHPGMSWTSGISSGQWVIPSVGETSAEVWYRIYLKATDNEGFSKVIHRDVFPEVGEIEVTSSPGGLIINLDGAPIHTPFKVDGVRGISRYITAPYKQVVSDSVYFFDHWLDGNVQVNREIRTSENEQLFEAYFKDIPNGKGYGLTAYYYDNSSFDGDPMATAIDSVIDHQFLLNAPFPGLPIDNFGILWHGYIQPYRTGLYRFTVFADDGVFLEIAGNVIIQNWEPGVHHENGEIFLEAGRLYPIHIRHYDFLWGAQIRLRWSCDDFPEEVIPSTQLYPEDFISSPGSSGILSMQSVVDDQLLLVTESYKEVMMDFSITTAAGITINYPNYQIDIGKTILSIDISQLPPGFYYLSGIDVNGGETISTSFVKIN